MYSNNESQIVSTAPLSWVCTIIKVIGDKIIWLLKSQSQLDSV